LVALVFHAFDTRILASYFEKYHAIKVFFRFSTISLDKSTIKEENRVWALYIQIPRKNLFVKIKKTLHFLHKSTATDFPLGIKMQFIPKMLELVSREWGKRRKSVDDDRALY
jgi:hypothetical protein